MVHQKMTTEPEVLPSIVIQTHTPDGTMYVTIMERNGVPYKIDVQIGKSGSSIRAWTDAIARLVSLALRSGVNIHTIVEEVSDITSYRQAWQQDKEIRSGPEGLAYSLLRYLKPDNRAK